ncbi:MAG: hypothetical protein G01um101419_146 [Parcubacteria group bacterium Gr01-1014_19]|nr:MAG: hypothetical protein G01um101419_146 [Parcubacteria group bacterium Gr01-1014_19]
MRGLTGRLQPYSIRPKNHSTFSEPASLLVQAIRVPLWPRRWDKIKPPRNRPDGAVSWLFNLFVIIFVVIVSLLCLNNNKNFLLGQCRI